MFARPAAVLAALVLVLSVAACSSSGVGAGAGGSGKLTVADAWARTSTGMDVAGAAYLTITNGTGQADALLGVSTPAATSAEIHETMAAGSGMMGMQPVDRVEIPAGQTVKLEPGGFHIMLNGLAAELKAGEAIELTLTFEKAGEIKVTAEVRAS
jgi:periplasmic copper chaperone A